LNGAVEQRQLSELSPCHIIDNVADSALEAGTITIMANKTVTFFSILFWVY